MWGTGKILEGILPALVLTALVLVAAGPCWRHFVDGVAQDQAIPVPNALIAGVTLPRAAYRDAAIVLQNVDPNNGEGVLLRAEAGIRAGDPAYSQLPIVRAGLSHAPGSARGWLLLAEIEAGRDNLLAYRALAQSILLSRRDFWLTGVRVQDAVALWRVMDGNSKQLALAQARLLWQEKSLRSQLKNLLHLKGGDSIMQQALVGSPDDIRELNRWYAADARRDIWLGDAGTP